MNGKREKVSGSAPRAVILLLTSVASPYLSNIAMHITLASEAAHLEQIAVVSSKSKHDSKY